MKTILPMLRYTILLSMVVMVAGCANTPKQPIYKNADFNPSDVDRLVILPVLDLRQDKSAKKDVNGIVQNNARSILKRKKYSVELGTAPDIGLKLTEEDLESKSVEWIENLAPAATRWIMLFAVHDVTRKLTFGSTGNAEMSAYLLDCQNNQKVWHDKGVGQAGQGGLLGMLMIGTMSEEALRNSVSSCLLSFPPKPKI